MLAQLADLLARQGRDEEAHVLLAQAEAHLRAVGEPLDLAGLLCLRGRLELGPTAEGFVRFSLAGGVDPPSKSVLDVVMYFDETDEAVIKHWADAIKTTYAVFQKFGGSADWRVEVGLVGMEDVRWYGQWNADSPVARKPSINIQRQLREWDPAALTALLSDAYAAIRNMFWLRVATPDDVKKLLPPDWEKPPRKQGQ